jgi:Cof subfamily protein (haloacid dehalogenase superfamily)
MRLCAFDIDNTLLPRGHRVFSKKTKEALNALLKQGDVVCLASGRPFVGVKYYLDTLGPGKKFAIVGNGSALYSNEGEKIALIPLTCSEVYYFQEHYGSIKGVTIYAYGEGSQLVYFKKSYFTELEVKLNHMTRFVDFKNEDHRADKMPIEKIMIASQPLLSATLHLTDEEKKRYFASRSAPTFYEILAPTASKGAMVEKLRAYLGVKKEDVYCFGDNNNDLTMVERFNGVAPLNASDEIKKAARYVSPKTCLDDGVAYAIKEMLRLIP